MKSAHQLLVEQYHAAISHGHDEHNMHIIHRDWHSANRNPPEPIGDIDPEWGTDLEFGYHFLQMHHEMVKASDTEEHHYMRHASIAQWYADAGHELPAEWSPLEAIPTELGYDPDPMAFPDAIRLPLTEFAQSQGITVEQFLTRSTNTPDFTLPEYFTLEGVTDPAEADPFTGAMKLGDFKNANQLGSSLVFPHDQWHGSIGGAMGSTWTAIADPIFYFGVHWHIDRVYDRFKVIETQRNLFRLDGVMRRAMRVEPSVEAHRRRARSPQQVTQMRSLIEASRKFHSPLTP